MTKQLPYNDPNSELAGILGQLLKTGSENWKIEDPLLDILLPYKKQRSRQTPALSQAESSALWDKLSDQTAPKNPKAKIFHIGRIRSSAAWAAAASVLIAALIGIYYFTGTFNPEPRLLAASGQQIKTVQTSDGSKITLRPNSSLFALQETGAQSKYKLEGEAYFKVKSRPEHTFLVQAGKGNVIVTGTQFTLSSWGGQTQVYLEKGSVRFENTSTNNSVNLKPGESARIQKDNSIQTTHTSQKKEFTDWLNNELNFTNKTAAYVFSELEQAYNIRIKAGASIRNTLLSGSISLENREQSLNDLALVLGGTFKKTDNKIFKFIPNP